MNKYERYFLYGLTAIGGFAAYKLFTSKQFKDAKEAVQKAHESAVDSTANVIATVSGLNAKQAQNEVVPPKKDSPEFQSLLAVVKAYMNGYIVSEEIWKLAYNYDPTYPTTLRAGKKWGYGHWWNYFGKTY
jgi:hypothetical protein